MHSFFVSNTMETILWIVCMSNTQNESQNSRPQDIMCVVQHVHKVMLVL